MSRRVDGMPLKEREDLSKLGTEAQGDARAELVQRIMTSPQFAKAPQLREILRYLSRRVFEDNPSTISEYDVGCHGLGRRVDFNPHEDNIVRVQIRHLRKKLDDYFENEGKDEPTYLVIPKGSYVPVFLPRESAAPAVPTVIAVEAGGPAARPKRATLIFAIVAGVLAVVFACVSMVLWWQMRNAHKDAAGLVDNFRPPTDPFWSRIFSPTQDTTIVVADSCQVMLSDLLKKDVPLTDYVSKEYPARILNEVQDPELRSALSLITSRHYTSFGDVMISVQLAQLCQRLGGRAKFRYARYLDPHEFNTGNFILIGSYKSVPWVHLFENQMAFFMEKNPGVPYYVFRNRPPHALPATVFAPRDPSESYADVALVPNLSGTGNVLMLEGINMEATEGAGEFLLRKDFMEKLSRAAQGNGSVSPYFELILQTKVLAGTPRTSKIVYWKPVTPSKTEP